MADFIDNVTTRKYLDTNFYDNYSAETITQMFQSLGTVPADVNSLTRVESGVTVLNYTTDTQLACQNSNEFFIARVQLCTANGSNADLNFTLPNNVPNQITYRVYNDGSEMYRDMINVLFYRVSLNVGDSIPNAIIYWTKYKFNG